MLIAFKPPFDSVERPTRTQKKSAGTQTTPTQKK
jgi:hypothetical protein